MYLYVAICKYSILIYVHTWLVFDRNKIRFNTQTSYLGAYIPVMVHTIGAEHPYYYTTYVICSLW